MHNSIKHILEITLFLVLIGVGVGFLFPTLQTAFMTNAFINGGIATVLLIGVLLVYKNMYDLMAAQRWSAEFREHQNTDSTTISDGHEFMEKTPRLIRPTATLLYQRTNDIGYLQINSAGMRAILDGLGLRIDETRETLRYVVGLLVFLGLLGTFWGLMQTIQAVSGVIDGLSITGSTGGGLTGGFESLKEGLKTPLSGMGTAFSSSLFGLAGSLLLGYCALRVSQAQNRFYQDYEEWLSSLTRLSGARLGDGEGDTAGMGLALSLLEQTADSLDRLQHIISKSETQQSELYNHVGELNQRLGTLVDSQKLSHELMRKLAEGQLSTRQLLERVHETGAMGKQGGMQGGNSHALEQLLQTLIQESRQGREQALKGVREELRIVSRTISNALAIKNNANPQPQADAKHMEDEFHRKLPPLTKP